MTNLSIIEIVLTIIVAYYMLGWITIVLTQLLHKTKVVLIGNDRSRVRKDDKPVIFWGWPMILPITLGSWLLYIPYLTLIKLTFKDS